MLHNGYPEWEAWQTARLHELWPTGMSLTGIGREVGMSRNAVASKRRREHLPVRPSPIRRTVAPVERGAKVTLPMLSSLDV